MTAVLGVTFLVVFLRAVAHGAPAGAAARTQAPSAALFMGALGIFVIAMVSWAPYVSDYSRYLPANTDAVKTFWAVVLGCAIPTIFCGALGAYVTGLFPSSGSTVAAVRDAAGTWALPIMAVSLIGSDVANSYTGMLAVASVISCVRDIRRSMVIRVVGSLVIIATGTICALLGYKQFVNNLGNFLNVLLYVFIPWSAINLTDYYLVKRGDYDVASFFTPQGLYGGWLWRGLIAYVLAIAVEVPFVDQTFYTGSLVGWLGGIDISWIVGGVAGFVFYQVALRISARSASSDLAVERPESTEEVL
jgi:NCS1 family nucleobase:cation symporter-1